VSNYEGIVGVTTKDGDDFEGRNTLDMGAVKLDQWVQYVITVVFSPDAGGGRMNVLRDGQNMGSVSGRTLKNATDPMSFYLNLYGDPRSPYASVDFDNLLIRSGGQAPPVITVLPKPTGLTATCNMTTKKFSVQWDPVPGALNYYLRVDYSSNNIEPQWHISEGIDYNRDGFVPVTFTGDALSGAYAWWVHGSNTNGLGPLTSGSFICVGPPPPPPPPPNGDTKAPTPGGAGTVTATP
jgi:hypothetical protein